MADILQSKLKIPTISPERLSEFDKQELDTMFNREVHPFHQTEEFLTRVISRTSGLEKHLMKKVTITRSAVLVVTHHNLKEVASWVSPRSFIYRVFFFFKF